MLRSYHIIVHNRRSVHANQTDAMSEHGSESNLLSASCFASAELELRLLLCAFSVETPSLCLPLEVIVPQATVLNPQPAELHVQSVHGLKVTLQATCLIIRVEYLDQLMRASRQAWWRVKRDLATNGAASQVHVALDYLLR